MTVNFLPCISVREKFTQILLKAGSICIIINTLEIIAKGFERMSFNKKIFAMLLERAKGDRSWRQFAIDCDISYVQMRKLAQCQQQNPPRAKLIKKISQNAEGNITSEDLLFCAGVDSQTDEKKPPIGSNAARQGEMFYEKYLSLSMGQRRMISDFIDFLKNR